MNIEGVFNIKGRGTVVVVTTDVDVRMGQTLRRVSDGTEWRITSVERHAIPKRIEQKVGLCLAATTAPEPEEGDEVIVVGQHKGDERP
jgi:hypothetical protein